MVTDNWPVDFRYISKRLVREIVQQSEASKPKVAYGVSVGVKAFSFQRRKRQPDYKNLFDLAKRAAEDVKDNTGTLVDPGEYVRTEVDITMGTLTVLQGWEESHVTIAMMIADRANIDGTLLALVGSVSNYRHRKQVKNAGGEIPSDVAGFYSILEQVQEPTDPRLHPEYVEDDRELSTESRVDVLLRLMDRFRVISDARMDILARVFFTLTDYSHWGDAYDRVILGAPVWVATPPPRPI